MRFRVVLISVLLALGSLADAPLLAQEPESEVALLPLALWGTIPGANGSEWKTVFYAHNDSDEAVMLRYLTPQCTQISPCQFGDRLRPRSSSNRSSESLPFYREGNQQGVLIRYPRHLSKSVHFNLRAQDISRQLLTWGTELPVVRESEFLTGSLHLLNIPLQPSFRHTIRIYDPENRGGAVTVTVFDQLSGAMLGERNLAFERESSAGTGVSGNFPGYIVISSIPELFPSAIGDRSVRLSIRPADPSLKLWGFASVTNNETQHVTTITPQK